jgi:hypothetical protein
MPVRVGRMDDNSRFGSAEAPLISSAVRLFVGRISCGCELPLRGPSTVSTEVGQNRGGLWSKISYISEDKKSDKERYIRVTPIDIEIAQGTWNIYHMLRELVNNCAFPIVNEQKRTRLNGSAILSSVKHYS